MNGWSIFAGPSGLDACVITSRPKPLFFDFIGVPFGGKSLPASTVPEHLYDYGALHRPILLEFLTERIDGFVHCFLMPFLVDLGVFFVDLLIPFPFAHATR